MACKSQPPRTFFPTHREEPSECNKIDNHPVKTETNLNAVMYMLMDIFSPLSATEHFMDEVRADKAAEAAWREQGQSRTRATPGTSRGPTRR